MTCYLPFGSLISDKIKLFLVVAMSVLWYGCTTFTLTKRLEKKSKMRAIHEYCMLFWKSLGSSIPQNSSCMATSFHITNHYSKTKQAGYCHKSKNEHVSDVLIWTCIHHLCTDTGYRQEDLERMMSHWCESRKFMLSACHDWCSLYTSQIGISVIYAFTQPLLELGQFLSNI